MGLLAYCGVTRVNKTGLLHPGHTLIQFVYGSWWLIPHHFQPPDTDSRVLLTSGLIRRSHDGQSITNRPGLHASTS